MRAHRRGLVVGIVVLFASHRALGYQAELVPASSRPEAMDITGLVTIGGADGLVHVVIENVNDEKGDPLDGNLTVHLKLRIAGVRRRLTIPLTVDTGDGEATQTLGLVPGTQVSVSDIRVRDPNRRPLAVPGVVTTTPAVAPPPPPPPPPDECPAALQSCQSDLADCNDQLDICDSGG
jgi:hypothetical protein